MSIAGPESTTKSAPKFTIPQPRSREEALSLVKAAARSGHLQYSDLLDQQPVWAKKTVDDLRKKHASKVKNAVSFSDAVPALREVGINLEAARAEAVQDHVRWGLVAWLMKQGIVSSVDNYGALFDKATFTQDGLEKIKNEKQKGGDLRPIFNPNNFAFQDGAKFLFGDDQSFDRWNEDGETRVINPYAFMEDFLGSRMGNINKSYAHGYDQGEKWEERGDPRVEFAGEYDRYKFPVTGSTSHQMTSVLQAGYDIVDPGSHLIHARHSIDSYLDSVAGKMGLERKNMSKQTYEHFVDELRRTKDSSELANFVFAGESKTRAYLSEAVFPLHAKPHSSMLEYRIMGGLGLAGGTFSPHADTHMVDWRNGAGAFRASIR